MDLHQALETFPRPGQPYLSVGHVPSEDLNAKSKKHADKVIADPEYVKQFEVKQKDPNLPLDEYSKNINALIKDIKVMADE